MTRVKLFDTYLQTNNISGSYTVEHYAIVRSSKIPTPVPKGYLVWSENCHMPSVDPLDNDYMETYERDTVPNCTETQPLIAKEYNKTLESYILHINMDLKTEYLNDTEDDIECCYKEIRRNGEQDFEWVNKQKY